MNHRRAIIRLVRNIGLLNEILPAHLHLVEVEVPCDGIDSALGNVRPLRPAITAIRIDRHGIGHDYSRYRFIVLDLVGAGPIVDRIHRGSAAGHVRQISSTVAQRFYFQTENSAVFTDSNLNVLRMRAAVARGLVAFRTRFPPLDWNAEGARQKRTEQLLRIKGHLCTEAPRSEE